MPARGREDYRLSMDTATFIDVSPIRLVAADRRRFAEWLALRRALYPRLDEATHHREMEAMLGSGDRAGFLVCDETGRAVGLLELSVRAAVDGCLTSPVGYIEGIYLVPAWRGRGIGAELVRFAEDWARQRGCAEIAADTELSNLAAQRFCERQGFVETYRIVEYRKPLA